MATWTQLRFIFLKYSEYLKKYKISKKKARCDNHIKKSICVNKLIDRLEENSHNDIDKKLALAKIELERSKIELEKS